MMPPSSRIEAVTIGTTLFSLNLWITLEHDLHSEWGRDSSRYNANSPQYYWKAQVKGFEFGGANGSMSKVRVRHAYEPRQLLLDPAVPLPRIPCNCESLSNFLFCRLFHLCMPPHSLINDWRCSL
jgi:hypothetical protein